MDVKIAIEATDHPCFHAEIPSPIEALNADATRAVPCGISGIQPLGLLGGRWGSFDRFYNRLPGLFDFDTGEFFGRWYDRLLALRGIDESINRNDRLLDLTG